MKDPDANHSPTTQLNLHGQPILDTPIYRAVSEKKVQEKPVVDVVLQIYT